MEGIKGYNSMRAGARPVFLGLAQGRCTRALNKCLLSE